MEASFKTSKGERSLPTLPLMQGTRGRRGNSRQEKLSGAAKLVQQEPESRPVVPPAQSPGLPFHMSSPGEGKRSTQHLAHPSPSGTSPGPSATSQHWGKWPRASRAGGGHVRRPLCPGQPRTSPEVVGGGKPPHGEGFCSRARGSGLRWWPGRPPQPPERQQPGSGAGKRDTRPWPPPYSPESHTGTRLSCPSRSRASSSAARSAAIGAAENLGSNCRRKTRSCTGNGHGRVLLTLLVPAPLPDRAGSRRPSRAGAQRDLTPETRPGWQPPCACPDACAQTGHRGAAVGTGCPWFQQDSPGCREAPIKPGVCADLGPSVLLPRAGGCGSAAHLRAAMAGEEQPHHGTNTEGV